MANDSILSAEEKAAVDRFWEDWHSRRARSRATNREFVQGFADNLDDGRTQPEKLPPTKVIAGKIREILKGIASFRPNPCGEGVEIKYHGDAWQLLRTEYGFLQGVIEQEIGEPVSVPQIYAQARALAS